jgi:hypothetical protein
MYKNKLQYVPLINLAHENIKISLFNFSNLDDHLIGQMWDMIRYPFQMAIFNFYLNLMMNFWYFLIHMNTFWS